MQIHLAKSPRQKIIITVVFTLVFTGAVGALVAWPSITTIKSLAEQIDEQRIELEELYQRGQILKQTLREYEEIKPTIPALNKVYMTKGNELEFITTLEDSALASGVSHDIKLTASDPKKPTNQLQYQLQSSGDLAGFIRYLAALESLDFYVNINTVRLSSLLAQSQKSNQSNVSGDALQAILLATSYFKP